MRFNFFRYPGGKSRLYGRIVGCVGDAPRYVEPFFGGGGFGLRFIAEQRPREAIISDGSAAVADLWRLVRDEPERLKSAVHGFTPSVEKFLEFRDDLLSGSVDGFKELVIHQISYSGLGAMSRSPLGGLKQRSPYKIDCRWSPDRICDGIDRANGVLSGVEIRHSDFEDVMKGTDSEETVFYVDPPYFEKGSDLYATSFSSDDHARLRAVLRALSGRWVLSYDDCPEVREMYAFAEIREVDVAYSIISRKGQRNRELLICSR